MLNKNWYKVFYIFTFIVFILSLIFFIYSIANKKYSSELIAENKKIREEINSIENKTKGITEDIDALEIEFNLKSQDFYEKYGYQFESNKSDEIKKIREDYLNKNKAIISEIKDRLKAYSAYFESNIYEKEGYEKSVNDFLELYGESNLDKHKNIYNELNIKSFVEESDGFAKTILKLNKSSKELNALVFYASIYTSNIYSYINNEKSSLSEIYADLNNLMFIYKEIERKGYKTGNLNSENLIYLNNFIEDKITSYYKNLGILKALEKSDKDEQK
ncbi:hypothetical protein [uncultured Peptoniphilus sp.]|uniref:hypothetical protein n=1 Tax=uncultured Peptoniphilus sp. TaxID=254354 RepID=UPI002584F523|nr:hypothetical protein [uncultured Peptoniphilus sp.]MDU4046308.1 hypothetical protein [Peptoniphilus harei]MDU6782992.1 hypothetical protein [Peptoniphilus harei]